MLLSPLSQNFTIWLPANFFYSEVVKTWKPVMKRKYLPYLTLEDMFNSQITSVNFPSISMNNVNQGLQNYPIIKRGGKQLDQQMSKQLTLTVKLSESYMTYFLMRQQIDLYLKFGLGLKNLYMPPINITILDEGGFENITYTYYELTPNSLSDFDLTYAAKPGSFSNFTVGFNYNYFDIYYRDDRGDRVKVNLDTEDGMLHEPGPITDKASNIQTYKNRGLLINEK